MTHSKVINLNGTRYAQVVGLGGATDFSLWNLFLRADFVVKFVIILLIACSIFSWALIFDKFKLFKNINKSIEDFEKKFWRLNQLKVLVIVFQLTLKIPRYSFLNLL